MSIRKILVATDFSPQADLALEHAMNIARLTGAEVVLMHATTVPQPGTTVPEGVYGAAERYEAILRDHLADNRAKLEELRERWSGQGVDVSQVFMDAFPDTAIARCANEINADLTVIGTHGRTGVKRFLLGSVAERAVRLTERNIMVARDVGRGAGGYKKILVPTDFSQTAELALDRALQLVAPGGAVELLHLWQLPSVAAGYWGPTFADSTIEPLRSELRESARALGANLVAKYKEKYPDRAAALTFVEVEDTPNHGIQSHLEADGHDLVVTGSHGRRGLRRWLLGSVAEVTIRYSPCSVLVVHAAQLQDKA